MGLPNRGLDTRIAPQESARRSVQSPNHKRACDWEQTCPIHDTWSRAQQALARELASTTMADLARIDTAIEAGTHQFESAPHPEDTARHGVRD